MAQPGKVQRRLIMCRPAEPVYDEAKAEAMSTDQRSTVASRNTGTHISSTPDCGVTTPLEIGAPAQRRFPLQVLYGVRVP